MPRGCAMQCQRAEWSFGDADLPKCGVVFTTYAQGGSAPQLGVEGMRYKLACNDDAVADCDGVVASTRVLDQCGVCGGNNAAATGSFLGETCRDLCYLKILNGTKVRYKVWHCMGYFTHSVIMVYIYIFTLKAQNISKHTHNFPGDSVGMGHLGLAGTMPDLLQCKLHAVPVPAAVHLAWLVRPY